MENKFIAGLFIVLFASIGFLVFYVAIQNYFNIDTNPADTDNDSNQGDDNNGNTNNVLGTTTIFDHAVARLSVLTKIPQSNITAAKNNLHVVYFHTSHGSQVTDGMARLDEFMGNDDIYDISSDGAGDTLHIFEPDEDDGYPYANRDLTGYTENFDDTTIQFLTAHPQYNVIIWSWCGLDKSDEAINNYLTNMNNLEQKYPNKHFIYMTGHLEGTGEEGSLHKYNEMIRDYCRGNNKILYDFADIESYNPDDEYFLDKYADDNCDYDSNGDGTLDSNWATKWQNTHKEDTYANGGKWYSCSCAHSQSLNGNLKAYAAWSLFSYLGGL